MKSGPSFVLKHALYYHLYSRTQHGPASHTVPVEDIVLSKSTLPSRSKRQDLGWLVQTFRRRCLMSLRPNQLS
ncbi:unnamed protein product [Penicillium nalgiovense]|nr:unnamed protein product [Penicillium nalgiovense]